MQEEKILWSQKAQSKSDSYKNFGYMLYEIIGGRLTLLAFLSLFSFSGYFFGYFGQFLSIAIGLLLFYAIYDAFNIFLTGIKLEYLVTKDNISFVWGISNESNLTIPFKEITKIYADYGPDRDRSAIIFENIDHFKNGDFGFSQERYFKQLSFENVSEIESLIGILNQIASTSVEIIQGDERIPWEDRLPRSNLYLKFLQLLAFTFLYFSTNFVLKIIDHNFIKTEQIVDTVISQETRYNGTFGLTNYLTTKKNHNIKLTGDPRYEKSYLNEEVRFTTTRLFKRVDEFHSIKAPKYEGLVNSYVGLPAFIKLLTVILMLFSCLYIFYKRGIVPFRELSIIILAPALALLISIFLFT